MLQMMRAVRILVLRPTILSLLVALAIGKSAFAQSTVAAGGNHTLVVKSDGTLWSFGFNNNGQLGDNTLVDKTWPQQVPGLSGIQAVAAGELHSMALTSTGTVYVWGDNFFNQVGDNTTTDRKTPVLLSLSNVIAIAAGGQHSLALTSDGKVYAWGRNGWGQAGARHRTTSRRPQLSSIVASSRLARGIHTVSR
jgi:alpha-tubulin suppressor-like RCC1 family protein